MTRSTNAALALSALLLFAAVATLTVADVVCDFSSRYRTLDGTCNNLVDPQRGAAGHPLYHPGWLGPRANESIAKRPSARTVSNTLMGGPFAPPSERLTDFFTFFAQFIDHDVVRFAKPTDAAPQLPIVLPGNEAAFRGTSLPFARLARARAPANLLSSYIDASAVYGTKQAELAALRDMSDGCKLSSSAFGTQLPRSGNALSALYRAGDSRVNENVLLIAQHTVWMRTHNALCGDLAKSFKHWGKERSFSEARKIVAAALQSVVYEQFLPAILGEGTLPSYAGYNSSADPRASLLFAGAAFRVGHVLVNADVVARHANRTEERVGVEHTLFAPDAFNRLGLDALTRGAVATRAKSVGMHVIDAMRNLLITKPGGRRLDLAAINIQRGRDLRVPSYNAARLQAGLPRALTFAAVTPNVALAKKLEMLYGSVHALDAWIGGLAEPPATPSLMGALFTKVWVDDFARMRDADRFFYKRAGMFDSEVVDRVPLLQAVLDPHRNDVMRMVLLRGTGLKGEEVPHDPFTASNS